MDKDEFWTYVLVIGISVLLSFALYSVAESNEPDQPEWTEFEYGIGPSYNTYFYKIDKECLRTNLPDGIVLRTWGYHGHEFVVPQAEYPVDRNTTVYVQTWRIESCIEPRELAN